MKANVYVTLKPGVLDPQGQAVHKTLEHLGFSEVRGVRIGKFIELELADGSAGDAARAVVERMCEQLIANTVMEDYRIELVASSSEPSA